MSGMKFRVQCSSCGETFFSPDRKARVCPKCAKKGAGGAVAAAISGFGKLLPSRRSQSASVKPAAKGKPKQGSHSPKSPWITPELKERIAQIFRERFEEGWKAGSIPWADLVMTISDELWLGRKAVSQALNNIAYPDVPITPEIKARIIAMYKGYVERGERPADGRRKTIGRQFGVPFQQVKNIVYQWSLEQYKNSPTPELTREQRFEIEKLYFAELDRQRHPLDSLPDKLTAQLGFPNSYQVSRWLDQLHDDDARFAGVPEAAPEVEERIIDAYKQYLAAPAPPEKGLHATIAEAVGGITTRQAHMTLQKYRKQRRSEYPLR